MARTYLPTLVAIVRELCVFITRYQETIRRNLGGEALTAFEAMHLACSAFLAAYDTPTPPA